MNVVWDMETGDPDDFMTMLWLADHPKINLKAVTVTPGSQAQIGLVRWGLNQLGRDDLDVGAYNIDHPKESVSDWHYRTFGKIPWSQEAAEGWEVLAKHLDEDTTLLTGAPLKNLKILLRDHAAQDLVIGRWVAQGGFAGDNVVSEEHRLEKFNGMITCPTYNFNGDPKGARLALAWPGIKERRCVSKNVCHGVVYDQAFHERVGEVRESRKSLGMIHAAMTHYLARHPEGKKFHDPLAACCALDPSIAEWAEVDIYRAQGKWGSNPYSGTNTWITVAVDHEAFLRTFTGT
jgi:pyrimidine-specific ribonucleoside hydrolase